MLRSGAKDATLTVATPFAFRVAPPPPSVTVAPLNVSVNVIAPAGMTLAALATTVAVSTTGVRRWGGGRCRPSRGGGGLIDDQRKASQCWRRHPHCRIVGSEGVCAAASVAVLRVYTPLTRATAFASVTSLR